MSAPVIVTWPAWLQDAVREGKMSPPEAAAINADNNPDWQRLIADFGCDFDRAKRLIDHKGSREIGIDEAAAEYYATARRSVKRHSGKKGSRPKYTGPPVRDANKTARLQAAKPKPKSWMDDLTPEQRATINEQDQRAAAAATQRMIAELDALRRSGAGDPPPVRSVRVIYTPSGGKPR